MEPACGQLIKNKYKVYYNTYILVIEIPLSKALHYIVQAKYSNRISNKKPDQANECAFYYFTAFFNLQLLMGTAIAHDKRGYCTYSHTDDDIIILH